MDNDDATIGRIYSRREILTLAGSAGATLAWGRFQLLAGTPPQQLVASPALTEGPFFVDEKLIRSNLRGETTRRAVLDGTPLNLEVKVLKLVGNSYKPLSDAQVDLWHADIEGKYSDVSAPMNHENTTGQNWLRGALLTDVKGLARFETIVPGCYPGRAPHIHFKVRKYDAASNQTVGLTSQMFFTVEDARKIYGSEPYRSKGEFTTTNARDGIYNERTADGSRAGDRLLLALKPEKKGFSGVFTIVLTDQNFRAEQARRRRGGEELVSGFDWATF